LFHLHLTEEYGSVHVNESRHREYSGSQGRVEDLADGVVQHVGRVQTGVGRFDLRRVVALVVSLKSYRFKRMEKTVPRSTT
jgi:hypothetical protein